MTKNKRSKGRLCRVPELLAPAGNFEKLITAVHYGADAIYLGSKGRSLRAKAGNFTMEEIGDGVSYAHDRGAKVYVTVNIFAHNRDFVDLDGYFRNLQRAGVDGLIIADPGILAVAQRVLPAMDLHLSTQANVTNYHSAQFWVGQGVKRLNLARELSMAEILEIRANTGCELEVFVHGAICISYSGRCMLSNYLTGRDANQGHCAHPCRFSYGLVEEKRPGQIFPVEEDERGTYIFNSKDLCLLEQLPRLMAAGVDSLKIEGRMKSIFYVGGVVRVYRAVIDYLAGLPEDVWENPEGIVVPAEYVDEIAKCGTRGMTENFFGDPPDGGEMLYLSSRLNQEYEPVGVVRERADTLVVEIRNTVWPGETIELMGQRPGGAKRYTIVAMKDVEGNPVTKANPGNVVTLQLEPQVTDIAVRDIFRRERIADKKTPPEPGE